MIEQDIPASLRRKAFTKAQKMGVLKNSILRGKGNVYGFVGELLVSRYMKCKEQNTFNYDMLKNDSRLEVKTKACSSEPKNYYECTVSASSIKQECDYFIFVRVLNSMEKGWILGVISKEDFVKRAKFYKEGEVDPNSKIGWKFKADCYNLPIKNLMKIETFLKKTKNEQNISKKRSSLGKGKRSQQRQETFL